MLTVGEMAAIGGVSAQTLRYYDRISLLKPAETDPYTNYRYYSLDQLMNLRVITVLKQCGLSLADIRRCLNQKEIAHIPELLEDRKRLIDEEIEQLKHSKELLDIEIRNIREALNSPGKDSAEIRTLPPRTVIFAAGESSERLTPVIMQVNVIEKTAKKEGWTVYGKPLIINTFYSETGRALPQQLDICLCIKGNVHSSGHVKIIPGGEYAVLYHHGLYNTVFDSFDRLYEWIRRNGYTAAGPPVMVIIVDMPMIKDTSSLLSEIQIRIEKVY